MATETGSRSSSRPGKQRFWHGSFFFFFCRLLPPPPRFQALPLSEENRISLLTSCLPLLAVKGGRGCVFSPACFSSPWAGEQLNIYRDGAEAAEKKEKRNPLNNKLGHGAQALALIGVIGVWEGAEKIQRDAIHMIGFLRALLRPGACIFRGILPHPLLSLFLECKPIGAGTWHLILCKVLCS